MGRGAAVFFRLFGACFAVACGAAPPAPAPDLSAEEESFRPRVSSDEQRAADALDSLFAACGQGDLGAAASGIVDRDNPSAEWHRAMNVDEPGRREAVQRTCDRLNGMLRGGAYERVAYRKERQSEGLRHLCTVRYAQSGEAEIYAFLEIQGHMLLGDIDPVR